MKIGIVTLPLHTNYGGLLQAYALQTVLERVGHEVEHLQSEVLFCESHPTWKMPLVWSKRAILKFLCGEYNIPIFTHPYKWIRKNTDEFIASHIQPRYLNEAGWNEELANGYDAIVFGSDQIWRPIYAYPIEKFFGAFLGASNVKRISYAASFGTEDNEYSGNQQKTCSELLKKFSAVSVREKSAVAICKERFGVDAKHLLDPTMLLSSEDYIPIFEQENTPKSRGSLAIYVLDENPQIDAFIRKQSSQKSLIPFRTNSKVENHNAKLSERQQPPVECWLRAFHDAEFVITDSFHACVFSILFHKPFICIGNTDRGMSRFTSLLKIFHLEDRLVSSLEDFTDTPINWEEVDAILATKRAEAMEFLTTALNPMG